MNYSKAQKEIFNALLRGDRVGGFQCDDDNFFVTVGGCFGYIFPVRTIQFNTQKIAIMKPIDINSLVNPENELKLTLEFRAESSFSRRMYRILKADGKRVYVNDKFLSCFQNPRFFQERANNIGPIIVSENANPKRENIPVGIVLPVRINDPEWKNE